MIRNFRIRISYALNWEEDHIDLLNWYLRRALTLFRLYPKGYVFWLIREQMGHDVYPALPWPGWKWAQLQALASHDSSPWEMTKSEGIPF